MCLVVMIWNAPAVVAILGRGAICAINALLGLIRNILNPSKPNSQEIAINKTNGAMVVRFSVRGSLSWVSRVMIIVTPASLKVVIQSLIFA